MSDRPRYGSIGNQEREAAAALFRDHGSRMAEWHALERREREAALAPHSLGIGRHAAEKAKRRQLRRELGALIDSPLIRANILTEDERRAVWLGEGFRRRPVRTP